jgi:hypothetical protein
MPDTSSSESNEKANIKPGLASIENLVDSHEKYNITGR